MATRWETIRVKGDQVVGKIRELVHEGNVRRVVIKQGQQSVAEFPLTVGVVGAVAAPVLAAVGAVAALATDCTVEVQRRAEPASAPVTRTKRPRTAAKDRKAR